MYACELKLGSRFSIELRWNFTYKRSVLHFLVEPHIPIVKDQSCNSSC